METLAKTTSPRPAPSSTQTERLRTRDGRELVLREIRPDDAPALRRGFAHLSPEEVGLRFLHRMTELPLDTAVHLCNLDHESAPALVLADPPGTPDPEIHAVARAYIDPATLCAEFAIVVQGRHAGRGFGSLLLQRLIDLCRSRGVAELC
jgi:GNAT superfamily N-acetyltransferase